MPPKSPKAPAKSSPKEEQPAPAASSEQPELTPAELVDVIWSATSAETTEELKVKAKKAISRYIEESIKGFEDYSKYNIIIIYDEFTMVNSDTDNIYNAVTKFETRKPILVLLHSSGGYISAAYLIGKLLHEYGDGELDIVVPRQAKSAATLLCCAADRIHMGGLSELGPIDPQIEGLPALGLKSSIEHIAALVKEYPQATDLFAKYMSETIKPIHLGYYERVAESAAQYAERLMQPHKDLLKSAPETIAQQLVYSYKDHGFVIDKQEAQLIFGDKLLKHNSMEYQMGNSLYQRLDFIRTLFKFRDYNFYYIGSFETGPTFNAKKTKK